MGDRPRFWFHVTYNGRLGDIAEHGLRKGSTRAIGAPAHDEHAKRGTFLTDAGGVFFWHARAEAFAEHRSDDVVEDGMIPVVLRVHGRALGGVEVDEAGSSDARAKAIIYTGSVIPPRNIQIWSGQRWLPIGRHDEIDFTEGVFERVEEEDDGPITLHYLKDHSPLMPSESEMMLPAVGETFRSRTGGG